MARRRRRRVRLGDSASVHARKLETTLALMEDFTTQGEKYLKNGLCRTATEALTAAIEARGGAKEHRSSSGSPGSKRLTEAMTAVQRLRLQILERCVHGD